MPCMKVGVSKVPWTTCLVHPPSLTPHLKRQSSRPYFSRGRLCQRRLAGAEGIELGETAELDDVVPVSVVSTVPQSLEWQLDFSSRPLLDERKKKVWELLICDPQRNFEFSQYFPNNRVNSAALKDAISALLNQEGARMPRRVKFFRGQMKTIINRALRDLEIPVIPSRRCFALTGWLNERTENVYPNDPRYAAEMKPLFTLDVGPPESLPDNLRGEAWDFVQLPLRVLMNETKDIEQGEIFGASIDLKQVGLDDLHPDTLIPGVSVYSRRAEPVAAWMSGLELAKLTADTDRSCLILETGVSERWRYGGYKPSAEATANAATWERAKQRSKGLHFLTVQDNPEAEYCFGLWLMVQDENVE